MSDNPNPLTDSPTDCVYYLGTNSPIDRYETLDEAEKYAKDLSIAVAPDGLTVRIWVFKRECIAIYNNGRLHFRKPD